MSRLWAQYRLWARSPRGRRTIRYSIVSIVSVIAGQLALAILFDLFGLTAITANCVACAAAAVPSYHLNRTWAWGKTGKSSPLGEMLPFGVTVFAGLGLSTWLVSVFQTEAVGLGATRHQQTLAVMAGSLIAFGLVWVVKYFIFNAYLFSGPSDRGKPPTAEAGVPVNHTQSTVEAA